MLGRIAIHLSDDHDCARRIEAGLMLARQHGAEAVGLYAPGGNLGRMYEENLLPPEASQILHQRYQADHDRVRELFLDRAAAVGAAAQWRALKGQTDVALSLHVRYCDLLVMSKSASTDRMSSLVSNLPEAVMMAAGRPVLMIPNHGTFDSIGQRVLYCWDQRREAARAFADAAPLLRQCQSLAVLEIDRDTEMLKEQGLTPDDFDHYCVSLGYPGPQHLLKDSEGYGVGNTILNTAADLGSDLIVMGAYGHSRMRQWIMGGASRTLLSTMTVPVLLSN
ncbi:universal stress protein [Castellaniella caeni]|uniref:universal stress protein n=1 Tax=Castellaniella caeni TaxID=266123 RepID=UPI000832CE1F|nr:universal stress protein [Castellaniella caeni]